MTDTPPPLPRLKFHVWLSPDDDPNATPDYFGVVEVRNVDQLTAETQAKGLGINQKEDQFHLTNLWIWAAMVRTEDTRARFPQFVKLMEYRPVEKPKAGEDDPDPSTTDQVPSTDSASPSPVSSEAAPATGDSPTPPTSTS